MQILEAPKKKARELVEAVARAVTPAPKRSRDPWNYDDERKAEINGRGRWLGLRRKGWLR